MKKFEKTVAGLGAALAAGLLACAGGTAAQADAPLASGQLARTGADGFLIAAGVVAALLVLGAVFMLLRNRRNNADDDLTNEPTDPADPAADPATPAADVNPAAGTAAAHDAGATTPGATPGTTPGATDADGAAGFNGTGFDGNDPTLGDPEPPTDVR